MVVKRGIMGVSMLPLGDLSGPGEVIATKVIAFRFSKSIVPPLHECEVGRKGLRRVFRIQGIAF